MNQELKKRLARNWFKILQEVICKEIEIIESRKRIFKKNKSNTGQNTGVGLRRGQSKCTTGAVSPRTS